MGKDGWGGLLGFCLKIHAFAGLGMCGLLDRVWDIFASTPQRQSDQKKPGVLNNLKPHVSLKDMK